MSLHRAPPAAGAGTEPSAARRGARARATQRPQSGLRRVRRHARRLERGRLRPALDRLAGDGAAVGALPPRGRHRGAGALLSLRHRVPRRAPAGPRRCSPATWRAALFLLVSPTDAFIDGVTPTVWGFMPDAGPLYPLFFLYFNSYMILGLRRLVRARRSMASSFMRNRAAARDRRGVGEPAGRRPRPAALHLRLGARSTRPASRPTPCWPWRWAWRSCATG